MERLTNAFFIAALGAFAVFALVIAVAMITGEDSDPVQPAAIGQASPEQMELERAEEAKAARERAAKRKARDRRRTGEVKETWNTVWGDNASKVVVKGGNVTVTAAPTEPDSQVSAIPGLCESTLTDHRWLARLRVMDASGAVAYHGVRGDHECSPGDIPDGREPAAKAAPKVEPEQAPSNDELAIQSFNRYVRQRGPEFQWDDLLVDVYITGMLTSTLNVEIQGTSAEAEPLCVLIEQWIVDVGGQWVSKAKVRRPVNRGHAVLAEC